jgi:tRNA-specific 2-thiouridylase
MASKRQTVLVAMSGGVDSSVAAALMARRGYDVIGLTMQIWQESQTDPRHAGCCSLGAVEDARRVARQIGIPHYVMNFKEEFRQNVIENFIDEYAAGRTPNPCVQCNRHVKFEILLQKMKELGCDKLVTGHYARIRRSSKGMYRLMRARGEGKDQSYVLYMLGQEQLAHTLFPLGEIADKTMTRKMAAEYGLHLAQKPDSQEICFVSEAGGYQQFLRKSRSEMFKKGDIVDSSGKKLGEHGGVADFTVGQRRGVAVSIGKPLYVLSLEPKENRVVVGNADELLTCEVALHDMYWQASDPGDGAVKVDAKIRYNMDVRPALLYGGRNPRLIFDNPVRAVTPGQMAVCYQGKTVVAGGTIK